MLRFRRDKARDRLVLDEAVIARLADEGAGESVLRERQMAALKTRRGHAETSELNMILGAAESDTVRGESQSWPASLPLVSTFDPFMPRAILSIRVRRIFWWFTPIERAGLGR